MRRAAQRFCKHGHDISMVGRNHGVCNECSRQRSRRKESVRPRTISMQRVTQRQLKVWRAEAPDGEHARPRTRGDCANVPRPCPFVGCRQNLYLDVQSNGNLKLNRPDIEPGEMRFSCCLDLAELGGMTLEQLGVVMNMTRERARQVEDVLLAKLAAVTTHLREELEP